MSTPHQPLVSVVIPTLNAGNGFLQLLEAIKAQQVPGDVETLVIDSHSQDGTMTLAQKAGAKVMSVPRRLFNHGRTRNQGIKASTGEFVALTVQDALPTDETWLARLLIPLLEQSEAAGSYGLQLAPPTSGLLARTRSTLWREGNDLPAVKSLEAFEQLWQMPPEKRLELIRFDNVTSCLRRSVWEQQPFPERNYGEDMAWAKSVLLKGHQVAYTPTAQVWHCHERGAVYELRRAYLDGYSRVDLVDWPSPSLTFIEALALVRKTMFFLLTKQYDSMVEPTVIRQFLLAEMHRHEPLRSSKSAQIYLKALRFALALTERAIRLYPSGPFPTGTWIELFRFATVAVVGQNLGATAAVVRAQNLSSERAAWNVLNWFLSRGV